MNWTHLIPPDTRAVGTIDPANDMNAMIEAIIALGAVYNVQNPVYAGGAKGDGVTDDTAAINAALAATPPGFICYFPPPATVYLTSAPLQIPNGVIVQGPSVVRPGKSRTVNLATPTTIKVKNAANLDAVLTDTIYTAGGASPSNCSAIQIHGIVIDGNSANQSAGKGHGIALMGNASGAVDGNMVQNIRGDGILLADQNAAGNNYGGASGITDSKVTNNQAYQVSGHAFHIQNNTGKITDGTLADNIYDGNFVTMTGYGVFIEKMGGWHVIRNHIYACWLDAFNAPNTDGGWWIENYADNWGQQGTLGQTYTAFNINFGGHFTFRDNFAACTENGVQTGTNSGIFQYFSLVSTATSALHNVHFQNNIPQQRAATASGTSTAFRFGTGVGGSIAITGIVSPLDGQNAGSGTLMSIIPVITGGTVTFPDFRGTVTTYSPSNPATTVSLTLVMMGMALAYTPVCTGKLRITIYGGGKNAATATIIGIGIRQGTGTAPVNGAAVTGTTVGKDQNFVVPTTGSPTPFCFVAEVTGLTLGTAAWVDLALDTNNAANASSVVNVVAMIEEVP